MTKHAELSGKQSTRLEISKIACYVCSTVNISLPVNRGIKFSLETNPISSRTLNLSYWINDHRFVICVSQAKKKKPKRKTRIEKTWSRLRTITMQRPWTANFARWKIFVKEETVQWKWRFEMTTLASYAARDETARKDQQEAKPRVCVTVKRWFHFN